MKKSDCDGSKFHGRDHSLDGKPNRGVKRWLTAGAASVGRSEILVQ